MKKVLKYLSIIFIIFCLVGPKMINSIQQIIREKKINELVKKQQEYEKTQEYKDKKKQEEYDIDNRYKNQEPFIGMKSKYVKHTLWGEPDEEYSRIYDEKGGHGIEYAYIWFSKDKKFPQSNGAEQVLRNTYHYYKDGDPIIEREIVVTVGTKTKGYISNSPIYNCLDEITEISDINNIHKYD